ncbi:MAG: CDP-diacylglycerol--serine O-phosphatidyltransferase [Flammeovirgaceae bacterium]|nr:CDP-diacylglycerol--serine O-phosphatidyltransferase [Flammeovirgaceae bacterium]
MRLLKHLPNLFTLGNLTAGVVGIMFAFQYPPKTAAYVVWIACLFDFLDGFTARQLNVSSPIGKQLDSLADVVSFGVLPSLVLFNLIDAVSSIEWLPYTALLIAACSALRLAKFNLDETQSDSFIGLPTPANALFITSLVFLKEPLYFITSSDVLLSAIAVIFSLLLIAPIPMFAMKFKNFTWKDNKVRFTFGALSVLVLIAWQTAGISLLILLYVLVSLVNKRWLS